MVNGETAYRNGNVTIGSGGTFLAKDTTAVIAQQFTINSQGTAVVDNASVEFVGTFDNSGVLTLRNDGTITGTGLSTIGGTLRGNGFVVPNATVTGTWSPGESAGTLNFSANLTLQSGTVLEFELGTNNVNGAGTFLSQKNNDWVTVAGAFTLDGTLNIAALDGFGPGTNRLFSGFSGTPTDNGLLIGTVPDGYNSSQFSILTGNGFVDLVVIPEPSAWTLVCLGLLGTWMLGRRRLS
jgi:fibronectin-binding autotransporter adhesin